MHPWVIGLQYGSQLWEMVGYTPLSPFLCAVEEWFPSSESPFRGADFQVSGCFRLNFRGAHGVQCGVAEI